MTIQIYEQSNYPFLVLGNETIVYFHCELIKKKGGMNNYNILYTT